MHEWPDDWKEVPSDSCLVLLARRCLLEPDLKAYEGPVKFFLHNVNAVRPEANRKPVCDRTSWWSQTGSNRRPHACKARALPTELWPRSVYLGVVGPGRLELPTLRLSGVRSNHLSYGPMAATARPETQARDRAPINAGRMPVSR